MKSYLKIFIFLLTVSVFNCQTVSNNVKLISPEELHDFLEKGSIQIIDVRTPQEYEEGHIPNAVNVNFLSEDFSKNITDLKPNQPVFVYCRSGSRSGKSVAEFRKAGFKKIYDLKGGILSWKEKGFQTVEE